ncbi:MAG TPA: RNA polymerase sigma factor [Ktedonobacteraceae bacterium]|nr:RNA polymerase sigma factor [Ktedonobacteraceae bacterium]
MQKLTCVSPCLKEASDSILAQQVLDGNHDAFAILMDRYNSLLYRFVYHYLGEYDQACDVVQHVFLQLYISLPKLLTGDQLKPWLLRVAQNSCRDELRKRRRRRVTLFSALEWQAEEDDISPLATLPDLHPLPDEVAEFNELQRRLMCAIQSLPTKFRSVVLLRYIHQYSFSEIGQVLEMPMTTAKTYYYRACSKLRTFLVSR